jgi:DNA topoisomerase-1
MGRHDFSVERLEAALVTDPVASAKAAGLRYVSDARPGITRRAASDRFTYIDADGNVVRDEATLKRIAALAIPPAWSDVWICPIANGHLQATGRDAKGRKQYRYHPNWRQTRDETKYHRMVIFGEALPEIRRRADEDLALHGLPREKVLAAVVRLLEQTLIRVGNEEYARENGSFGLTTMRNRHVEVFGARLHFHFRGKSGIVHSVDITNRRLAAVVRRCRELSGQALFEYEDDEGMVRDIGSGDVNDYLRAISDHDFTAKDFRTWAGTVRTADELRHLGPCESETQGKKNIVQAIQQVSKRLGNTPAVCRKCYVHPAVLESYLDGTLFECDTASSSTSTEDQFALAPDERWLLELLKRRLAAA